MSPDCSFRRVGFIEHLRDRDDVLKGANILIVEDEAIIAMHLAIIVEDLEGQVVGPAASVAEALDLIAAGVTIQGAMLDGNLGDGDVTPVALQLIADAVPLVIYSGVGIPPDLACIHPDIPVFQKPLAAAQALDLLAIRIADAEIKAVMPVDRGRAS